MRLEEKLIKQEVNMGISLRTAKDWIDTRRFLSRATDKAYLNVLHEYGRKGVAALSSVTPIDTGRTAASWSYEVDTSGGGAKITWSNSNTTYQGTPIAIMLQYGHGTGSGGYVAGRDYINPAIAPIFDDMAEAVWKAVKNL